MPLGRVVRFVILAALCSAIPLFAQDPVQESEPNDTPASADLAVRGGKVMGRVDHAEGPPDSVDYWVIHAEAGDTIHVAVSACRTCVDAGIGITLLDADGVTTLATGRNWDANDPQLAYVATRSGPYYVHVTATIYSGTQMAYTLSFAERKCSEQEQVREPNNTRATATPVPLGSDVHAFWCPYGDRDFYTVTAEVGTILEFGVTTSVLDGYFGEPGVGLLGPDGQVLPAEPTSNDRWARYEVQVPGTYYLVPGAGRGRLDYPYVFTVRAVGQLPASPGDPPTVRVQELGGGVLAADRAGNLWAASGGISRLALDGTRTLFQVYRVSTIDGFAWDGYGNMLISTQVGVRRFAPPNVVRPFIDRLGASGLAVGNDGIWVGELEGAWDEIGDIYDPAHRSHRALHRYSMDGQLQATYDMSALEPYYPRHIVVGPSGDLYLSAANAIYRLVAGRPELVLRTEDWRDGWIEGFTFDKAGNIYVIGNGRVSLYHPNGAIISDPFSWWPIAPNAIAFGRDADGSTNAHLLALDQLDLIELNPAGISAPGLPVGIDPVCPAHHETEPNGAPETATPIPLDTIVMGMSCPAGDGDFFRFTAPAGKAVTLDVEGADEPILSLLAGDGRTRLAHSEDTAQFHARGETVDSHRRITYTVQTAGTHYIAVGSRFGGPRPYMLRVGNLQQIDAAALTLMRAGRELARPTSVLSATERAYLDMLGNNNGRYDVGDFRAFLTRQRAQASQP